MVSVRHRTARVWVRLQPHDFERLRHYAAEFDISASTLAAVIVKERLDKADELGYLRFRPTLEAPA